ncbi:50S ribosomal protein L18 [Candidatus Woesearchaeota archaeon]|nr:50S ribosomal protein L18 [Candidatus Woesearchaeota archaeon]
MRKTRRNVSFRRKLQGKTNYRKRLALLKSGQHRLVVRTSIHNTYVQLVEYQPEGDKIVVSADTKQLAKLGWKFSGSSVPAAYLAGLMCAKKSKGVKQAVLDAGPASLTKGCRIYAALKGAIDGGLEISASEEVFPSEDRITGKHIEDYAKSIAGTDKYNKIFSLYLKQGAKPEEFVKAFGSIKSKIEGLK